MSRPQRWLVGSIGVLSSMIALITITVLVMMQS